MITILEESIDNFINEHVIKEHKNHCGQEPLLKNEFICKGRTEEKLKFVYKDCLRLGGDVEVIKIFEPVKYDDLNTKYILKTIEVKSL